jgi:hypothetical protein
MSADKMPKPVLYPAAQNFLSELAEKDGTPIYKLPVKEARAVLDGLQAGPVDKMPVDIEDRLIPVRYLFVSSGPRATIRSYQW